MELNVSGQAFGQAFGCAVTSTLRGGIMYNDRKPDTNTNTSNDMVSKAIVFGTIMGISRAFIVWAFLYWWITPVLLPWLTELAKIANHSPGY